MIWDGAILLSKWLSYLAMVATPGALLISWLCALIPGDSLRLDRHNLSHYVLPATVLGILASSLFFLLQVGAVNQRGPAGMFDPVLAGILAESALGDGLRWRLSGFFLALICAALLFVARIWPPARPRPVILSPVLLLALGAVGLLSLAMSFAVLGHASQLGLFSRLMVVLHVSAVCMWIGALVPLYSLCGDQHAEDIGRVGRLMTLFGQSAWIILAALMVSGGWLLWHLTGDFAQTLSTGYGRLLLLKLVLVAGLLGLGARHRYHLVPGLTAQTLPRLRRSIALETALAGLILLLTAILTTITGPVV